MPLGVRCVVHGGTAAQCAVCGPWWHCAARCALCGPWWHCTTQCAVCGPWWHYRSVCSVWSMVALCRSVCSVWSMVALPLGVQCVVHGGTAARCAVCGPWWHCATRCAVCGPWWHCAARCAVCGPWWHCAARCVDCPCMQVMWSKGPNSLSPHYMPSWHISASNRGECCLTLRLMFGLLWCQGISLLPVYWRTESPPHALLAVVECLAC